MAKSKLTPARHKAIVDALAMGCWFKTACRAAGVDPATGWRWRKTGEDTGRQPYRDFCDAVKKAEAQAEVVAVAMVRSAFPKNWAAAMTFLERRFPDRWRRRATTEIGGPARNFVIEVPTKAKTREQWIEQHSPSVPIPQDNDALARVGAGGNSGGR